MLSRGTWIVRAPDTMKAIPPYRAVGVVTPNPRNNATIERPPSANPNTVTQLLHEYGRSARTIARGKYGLPSPPAVNVCPSPWYGFPERQVTVPQILAEARVERHDHDRCPPGLCRDRDGRQAAGVPVRNEGVPGRSVRSGCSRTNPSISGSTYNRSGGKSQSR